MTSSAAVPARAVYAVLLAYAIGLALFWPSVFLIVDEERYVSQAVAFAQGATRVAGAEILLPSVPVNMISDYPPGTSLLQAPFVWAFGWKGGVVLSFAALVLATLATMRWLTSAGKSPAFALLVPAFAPTLFFGRIAMSDVPSAALVACAGLLLWRADRHAQGASFGLGFAVTASVLLREPLVVLLAPLALGAAVRGRVAIGPVVLGAVMGAAPRLALSWLFFDTPWFVRDAGYGFSLESLRFTVGVHAVVLLAMFPGGALLPFLYRGERRAELVAATVAYVGLFLLYDYDGLRENGPVKGLVAMSRFMIPLAPVLAFMAADVWPRLHARLTDGGRRLVGLGVRAAVAAVVVVAIGVHAAAAGEERDPRRIVTAVYEHTEAGTPVITNPKGTLKYFSPSYGPRRLLLRDAVVPDSMPALESRFGPLAVVFLDRLDSDMFRTDARANDEFLAAISTRCTTRDAHAERYGTWASLRVVRVTDCGGSRQLSPPGQR
jgi:4-amino-4-deoxy-L-arabinose transferase-like glycosyltransferase